MMKNGLFIFIFFVLLLLTGIRLFYFKDQSTQTSYKKSNRSIDRHLMSDTLIYIFGPDSRQIVLESIFEIGSPFGGNCDFYNMTYNEHQKVEDPFTRCPAGIKDINSPVFVPTNPIREAAVERACHLLTQNSKTISHALKIANISDNSKVDLKSYENIYFLFHKENLMTLDKLSFVLNGGLHLHWKELIKSICVSAKWQAI